MSSMTYKDKKRKTDQRVIGNKWQYATVNIEVKKCTVK